GDGADIVRARRGLRHLVARLDDDRVLRLLEVAVDLLEPLDLVRIHAHPFDHRGLHQIERRAILLGSGRCCDAQSKCSAHKKKPRGETCHETPPFTVSTGPISEPKVDKDGAPIAPLYVLPIPSGGEPCK